MNNQTNFERVNPNHNLTGASKNGIAETTVSKKYHYRRKFLTMCKILNASFISQRRAMIEGYIWVFTFDTVTRRFYIGSDLKNECGRFAIDGMSLILTWNEESTGEFSYVRLHFSQIDFIK